MFVCVQLAHQATDDYRGTAYAKECGDVGYCADVRLLVLLLAENHRTLTHRLRREYSLEASADTYLMQALA